HGFCFSIHLLARHGQLDRRDRRRFFLPRIYKLNSDLWLEDQRSTNNISGVMNCHDFLGQSRQIARPQKIAKRGPSALGINIWSSSLEPYIIEMYGSKIDAEPRVP